MNLVEKFFDFINGNNAQTNTTANENEKSNNTKKNAGIKDSDGNKDAEKFRFLVGRVNELMSEHIAEKVPQRGSFGSFSIFFNIPCTQNKGRLVIEYSLTGEDSFRRLRVDAYRNDTDRVYSNYILNCTNSEIIQYLSDADNVDVLVKHYSSLSDSVDEYWD